MPRPSATNTTSACPVGSVSVTVSNKRPTTRDDRKADLAAIHIAKKTLRFSDDEYRDVMATVCGGVRSAALLDVSGRRRLIAHLQACVRANGGPTAGRKPLLGRPAKMWSLWMQLADAGLVQHRTMAALVAFSRRQTGVARLEWLKAAQQDLVIESLKRWLDRGVGHGTQG